MKEELISFETAKLAKEVGFECNVSSYYKNGKLKHKRFSTNVNGKEEQAIWDIFGFEIIAAPTQSLLQKWLREVHNITVWVEPYSNGSSKCTFIWNRGILNNIWILDTFSMKKHNTYEEALEAGLLEALKLIKT